MEAQVSKIFLSA